MDGIIGRDAELTAVDEFLAGVPTAPGVLLLEGVAGVGKTTLWNAAVAAATQRGFRVLSCRPAATEAKLSFCGLDDLLDGVVGEVSDSLPAPQRQALDAVLLRGPSTDTTRGRCAGRCWRPCGCSPVRGRSCWRLTTCSGSIGRPLRWSSTWCVGSPTNRSGWCLPGARRRRRRYRSGWLDCHGPSVCVVFGSARSASVRSSARPVAPRAVIVEADPGSCSRDLGRQPVLRLGDRPCSGRDRAEAGG